jgi:gamma-glutamylputrescine oxidase
MIGTSHPYWLDIPLILGQDDRPTEGQICIIGSGLSGVSTAYWLLEKGYEDLVLVDFAADSSATFRNCGHILYGTVESMSALVSLHGESVARDLWALSIDMCHEVRDTVARLGLDCEYRQDGYLVIAIDESEEQEIRQSIDYLNRFGFQSNYVTARQLGLMGFREVYGARFEAGSAQAHPTQFRNGLLQYCLKQGLRYYSGVKVLDVSERNDKVYVTSEAWGAIPYEAAVVAANAYSPLLSRFFAEHRLIEPYRGQIITSKPLRSRLPVAYPHSFDHGYEYALRTADNRLMIGGWRNHTPHGETGTYDLTPNPLVEEGLKEFVKRHYHLDEEPVWDYSWAGIMAASKTGFPFIGPTSSPRIYTVAGYTGHGFSWAHGSARLLADIINGEPIPAIVAQQCNPRRIT